MSHHIIVGVVAWFLLLATIIFIQPHSEAHKVEVCNLNNYQKIESWLIIGIVIAVCTLPMGLSPIWNGEIAGHRNQYEKMAEAILDGHLYMDIEVDPMLLEMENPYDAKLRDALNIEYEWDHSLYNGHYYMYFGVVPVFLVFIPWRLITGNSLTTYHATQLFVGFYIIGVFFVFKKIATLFFPKLTFSNWTMLSAAFSIMSIWYSVAAPALYCTAITSGLCMQIWSIYFFIVAVWDSKEENKAIRYAFLGSLFGALSFGCRPPIALFNIAVIPLLVIFLKKNKLTANLIVKLLIAALPYIIIGCLLMEYNYLRYNNPFEFGQSYQLTEADQSQYFNMFSRFDWSVIGKGLYYFMIGTLHPKGPLSLGAFVTFPILLSIFLIAYKRVRFEIVSSELCVFVFAIVPIIILVIFLDTMWTPVLISRSRMDIYWLLGLLDFIILGFWSKVKRAGIRTGIRNSFYISVWAFVTILTCYAFYFYPNDNNFAKWYGYDMSLAVKIFTFGLL